jgi:hypothetical protein
MVQKLNIGQLSIRRAGIARVATCGLVAMLTACSPVSPTALPDTSAPTDAPLLTTGVSATPAAPTQPAPKHSAPKQRSISSTETRLLTTGEFAADASTTALAHLPQPDLIELLPSGLPQVGPDAALGLIATPKADLTAAYADPSDAQPVLALNDDTDQILNMSAHWTVVGQQGGWVRVLTPVGRGSLPSQDKSQVNHHAVWVKASDVDVAPAQYRIEVDTEAYTMTVNGPSGPHTFHIGVGKVGKTETPKGLCAIVGKVMIQTGEPGLLTNCQSEMLDEFDGAADAATAIHEYDPLGFNPATGGAVSNGCMRIPDAMFEKYLSNIPAGTPLIIR